MKPVFMLMIIAALCITSTFAQTAIMEASAPGAAGESIEIFKYSDPVTKQLELLGRVQIGELESFEYEISCKGIQWIQIRYGIYSLLILVEEGNSYDLTLPDYMGLSKHDRINPYFEYAVIHLPDNNELSLNNAVRELDSLYFEKANIISTDIYLGEKLVDRDSVLIDYQNSVMAYDHPYYKSYSDYRNCLIELLGRGSIAKSECISSLNDNFDPDNPACLDLYNQLFKGYIRKMSLNAIGEETRRYINIDPSPDSLKRLILSMGDVSDNNLLEFILLQNLHTEYYEGRFSKNGISRLMEWMSNNASEEYSRFMGRMIYEKINRMRPGSRPPDFNLTDAGGKVYSLDSLTGRYSILILAESDSWLSMSEFRILKTWFAGYSDDLSVISILLDEDFTQAGKRMMEEKFNWIILDGSNAGDLLRKYDVRYLPAFYLLNRESEIIQAPSILPSENLRALIMQQLEKDLMNNLRN